MLKLTLEGPYPFLKLHRVRVCIKLSSNIIHQGI
jgi:hypothetical protein